MDPHRRLLILPRALPGRSEEHVHRRFKAFMSHIGKGRIDVWLPTDENAICSIIHVCGTGNRKLALEAIQFHVSIMLLWEGP